MTNNVQPRQVGPEPAWVRAPMDRDVALALLVARSDRYPDWVADRVTPGEAAPETSER
ncbi:MAG: hypothetical protein ACRDY1_13650 [Acidimicrobiales bacterium]